MNQQTSDQGWQQLQAHIEGFFDHVLRKEQENAMLSRFVSMPEAKLNNLAHQAQICKAGDK